MLGTAVAQEPLAFYTVTAGLIPVLYLALAWQAGVWSADEPKGAFARLEGARYMALVVVIGEATALDVLARDRPSTTSLRIVGIVLITLASPLIMSVLRPLALKADLKRIEHDGVAFESVTLTIVWNLVTAAAILRVGGLL
jgi:hypothetical protein